MLGNPTQTWDILYVVDVLCYLIPVPGASKYYDFDRWTEDSQYDSVPKSNSSNYSIIIS